MSTLKADTLTTKSDNTNISITGAGTGKVALGDGTLIFPDADGSANQPIITNGSAALSFATLPIAGGGTGSTSTTYCNLTSNVTGTMPVANGGTGATTLTANSALLGNGTSALQAIAPGSSGNVLTSDGSTWASATAGGGAWSVITRTVVSDEATVAFTGFDSSTYGGYQILIRLTFGTDNNRLFMRTSSDGGTSYDDGGSDYRYYILGGNDTTSSPDGSTRSGGAGECQLASANTGNASGENWAAVITIMSPEQAVNTYYSVTAVYQWDSVQFGWTSGGGMRASAADVDAIRFHCNSGNIGTGEFTFLGLKKA